MFARLLPCLVFLLAGASSANAASAFPPGFLPPTTFASTIDPPGQFAGASDFPPDIHDATLWRSLDSPRDPGSPGEWRSAGSIGSDGNLQQALVNACAEFGDCRTGLSTPAPEPGALLLLVAGLLTVGAGRYGAPRSSLFR